MFKSILTIVTSAALALAITAQAQSKSTETELTDAQIAKIVVVADTVDVNYGKLAADKTDNREVKAFAETMIRDHNSVNKQATELAKKLKITPKDSEISKTLEKNGKTEHAKLEKLHGKEFDKAYIDNEVEYHQAVIKTLDEKLIPEAENSELKALLESGRPIFIAHLEHAKQIQKSLNQ